MLKVCKVIATFLCYVLAALIYFIIFYLPFADGLNGTWLKKWPRKVENVHTLKHLIDTGPLIKLVVKTIINMKKF